MRLSPSVVLRLLFSERTSTREMMKETLGTRARHHPITAPLSAFLVRIENKVDPETGVTNINGAKVLNNLLIPLFGDSCIWNWPIESPWQAGDSVSSNLWGRRGSFYAFRRLLGSRQWLYQTNWAVETKSTNTYQPSDIRCQVAYLVRLEPTKFMRSPRNQKARKAGVMPQPLHDYNW